MMSGLPHASLRRHVGLEHFLLKGKGRPALCRKQCLQAGLVKSAFAQRDHLRAGGKAGEGVHLCLPSLGDVPGMDAHGAG